jgi:hypothetical protein
MGGSVSEILDCEPIGEGEPGALEVLEGEIVEDGPAPGTKAWLETLPLVEWEGLEIPSVHRAPAGASAYHGEDDGKCRIIRPDGRRCGSNRCLPWGLCLVHAGGGMQDFSANAKRAAAIRHERARIRMTLGIGPRKAGDPRQMARIRAQARANALAQALVDGPLDAEGLSALERQRAAVTALDATFPVVQASVTLELPETAEDAASMGWREMRELAAKLL